MTFFLGWLLGSITFVAGWATHAALVEHNAPRLVVHPEQPIAPPINANAPTLTTSVAHWQRSTQWVDSGGDAAAKQ